MLQFYGQRCKARRSCSRTQLCVFCWLITTSLCIAGLSLRSADYTSLGRVSWTALFIAPAEAKEKKTKSKSSGSEAAKQLAETQREQAKQAAELQREQAKQAVELQREQAKQASEIEREETRQATEREQEDGAESTSELEDDAGSGVRPVRGTGTGGESTDDDDSDERPPRTVAEMLQRLSRPDKPRSAKSRGGGSRPSVDNGPRGRNEILAVNLSAAGAAHARKLGFDVRGSSRMSHLNGEVTRLVPPRGMDAAQARDAMRNGRPGEQFAVNQRYAIYQPARKDMSGRDERSEPARHGSGSACTNDRCFGQRTIRWHEDIQPCAERLRIGVIDTPVDHAHPAFSKAKIHTGGFLPDGANAAPAWHGTGVLSLLAGDTNSGTPGLIPHANFYVATVFFQEKNGEIATDTLSVINALEWMSAFDVKIINMSFSGPRDELVETTIQRMSDEGVLFVAAAGNDGPAAAPGYPASYRSVVAVTAVGKELRNYPYANRGEKIDAAAPGVDIWSAVPDAREGYHTGTSFAAPYVTAILATAYDGKARRMTKDELLDRLPVLDLGPAGRDPIYGRGLMLAPATCGDAGTAVAQRAPSEQTTQTSGQSPVVRDGRAAPSSGPLSLR